MKSSNYVDLLQEFGSEQKHRLSENSLKTYQENIRNYEAVLKLIPNAPPPFPPTIQSFGAFLTYKKNMGVSFSTLKSYKVAMSFYCVENGIEDITKSKEINDFMQSMNRKMLGSSFPYSSDALTPNILGKICEKIKLEKFIDVRDMAMFSVQFEAMLRVSEIINLLFEDVIIQDNRYVLKITKTKVDQNGRGRQVVVYSNEKIYSSFYWLLKYVEIRGNEPGLLFKSRVSNSITSFNVGYRLKYWIKKIGFDPSAFSTHSLRKGGAQTAAFNGAFASAIQHQGGWRSSCFLKYTQFDEEMAGLNLKGKT